MLEAYLNVLDLAYFEVGEAFKGLADELVWRRPSDKLLSVGELAGHIAFWEAVKFAGASGGIEAPDLTTCRVISPLVDPHFKYYTVTVDQELPQELLSMGADAVHRELVRVHEEAMADLKSLNPDLNSSPQGWPSYFSYGELLKYASFHVSYHTGQMYTVRHLLGDVPPDN